MEKKIVVSILAAAAGVLAAASCGDHLAPTAPNLVPAAGPPPPAAAAGGGSPAVPPARQADLRPAARADVRGLQPGQWTHGDFNAYDFEASWDGSMLHLALIEDEMRSMREASKPHRNRLITVGTCPVEPHHKLQSCGAPIWSGTRMLAGRLELPPIPLAECAGWIIVNAAELSDDLYDGWRNAPCPDPDDETGTGSDGSGDGWPEYPEPETNPEEPEERVGREVTETLDVPHSANNRVRTPFSIQIGRPPLNNVSQAQGVARTEYNNFPPAMFNPSMRTADQIAAAWQALADTAAATHCTGEGYERAASVTTGTDQWEYSPNQNQYANTYQFFARRARTWAATCERTVIVYE